MKMITIEVMFTVEETKVLRLIKTEVTQLDK